MDTDFHFRNLVEICKQLDEKEESVNKNFWAVNMHGKETERILTIPSGVRLIVFCYPGKSLHICKKFDEFNWREIFTNEDATFSYCTFLANLCRYPSLRDHFCVYTEGYEMTDLFFTTNDDDNFLSGIFQLPVRISVHDRENKEIYLSSPEIFSDVSETYLTEPEKIKKISVNPKKVATMINENEYLIFSEHFQEQNTTLSNLIKNIKQNYQKEFTLLLLTCRSGKRKKKKEKFVPTVKEELEELYLN